MIIKELIQLLKKSRFQIEGDLMSYKVKSISGQEHPNKKGLKIIFEKV